jgi:hypothetical protein
LTATNPLVGGARRLWDGSIAEREARLASRRSQHSANMSKVRKWVWQKKRKSVSESSKRALHRRIGNSETRTIHIYSKNDHFRGEKKHPIVTFAYVSRGGARTQISSTPNLKTTALQCRKELERTPSDARFLALTKFILTRGPHAPRGGAILGVAFESTHGGHWVREKNGVLFRVLIKYFPQTPTPQAI